MTRSASALSPLAVVIIVVVVLGAMAVTGLARRRRASAVAAGLGGGVGRPNPAVPPASDPDHRSGIVTSGPPVQLTVCGLPALVWQRTEHSQEEFQPMRLALIADSAAALPPLQYDPRGGQGGAVGAWAPVLAAPAVRQAMADFPLGWLSVLGGRLTFVSRDGLHLDRGSTAALARLAAAVIEAIPPGLVERTG